MTACSFSPGVPGIKVISSKNEKPQKEGIDYKLVVINQNAIQNQKPFDYAGYIQNQKRRHNSYNLSTNSRKILNTSRRHIQPTNKQMHKQSLHKIGSKSSFNLSGTSSSDNRSNYQYRIGKQDILSITVWEQPELTMVAGDTPVTHVVGNDGRFYFPYAGKIRAEGKTGDTIREELEKKLKSFITKPQVSVVVANYRSQKAYISGAIAKPITLAINDLPLTVRDAISRSGGVTPRKYTGFATLTRKSGTINIDLNRMLKFNDNRQNFILRNGDRLHVIEVDEESEFQDSLSYEVRKQNAINPIRLRFELQKEKELARLKKELERELKTEQAKVFVMGEVSKPGSVKYQVEDGMTLAEAINDAGSLKEETVNIKGIFVVRKESANDKVPTVYQLPVRSVHSMLLAEQFNIRPRDIVYVTATPSIRWNRVLAQLLPSLAILNTFRNFN